MTGKFSQIYTIDGLYNGTVLPCVYALVPGKPIKLTNQDYSDIWFQTLPHYKLHIGFDQFEGLFSFCRMRSEENIRKQQLIALAFVPQTDDIVAFETLINSKFFTVNYYLLIPFVDCFEDNFISRFRTNSTRPIPLFPPKIWNQHDSLELNLARTNNDIERWHNAFARMVQSHHHNIIAFIECLQLEQSKNELRMIQLLSGNNLNHQRRVYRDENERLRRIIATYNPENISDYLRGISHNVNYYS
ncbi:hypothetical protein RF11_00980 [Thelohanellus kitauei]|uniref:Uncharacterized protein n=1 Tax=Thelohanellus kitauei TaxID=669202 RepID=A0A0C2MJ09_THEKT|nr:hypothetical protein RF11_00980 [Thelohanellus kitauei]